MLYATEETLYNAVRKYLSDRGFNQVNPTMQPLTINVFRGYNGGTYSTGGSVGAGVIGFEYFSNMRTWSGAQGSFLTPAGLPSSMFFGQISVGIIAYGTVPATYTYDMGVLAPDPGLTNTRSALSLKRSTQAGPGGQTIIADCWQTMDENATMIPFSDVYFLFSNGGAAAVNISYNFHFEGYAVYGL